MNKLEFIESLKAGLSFLSPAELNDVIAEFEEHFEVGMERGYTEQQLVDQLGDPKHIATAYRAEILERNALHMDIPTPVAPEPPRSDSPEPPKAPKQPEAPSSTSRENHFNCDGLKKIVIDSASFDIRTKVEDVSEVRVYIDERTRDDIVVDRQGDTLMIRQAIRPFRFFAFAWQQGVDIEVTLPLQFKGIIEIKTASGDAHMDGFKGESLSIHTASGDIRIGETFVEGKLSLGTASGDIASPKCVAQTITANTASGDIWIDSLTAVDLKVNTASGDIWRKKGFFWEAKHGSIQSASGDIRANFNDHWKSLNFHSMSGDVRIALPDESRPFEIGMSSMSGDKKSKFSSAPGSGRKLSVVTMSGDIKIKGI